jgi:SAM-dependent methyltransferase
MDGFAAGTYGDRIADVYDGHYRERQTEREVEFLASVVRDAGGGPALELGIGTGRVALPLAARGIEVHGVDASVRMVERMRAKPGGDAIPVTTSDFADFDLGERFGVVYVVFNTFFALPTQDAQVRCFETVARHLRAGGRFVLEGFVPDVARFDRGQRTGATVVDVDELRIDASIHDAAEQRVRSQHVIVRDGSVRMYPVSLRYAWPSELDLMARLADLAREARHGGYGGEPFTSTSGAHVSVYRKN